MTDCFCGCGEYATEWHHAIYVQELRRIHNHRQNRVPWLDLLMDTRNLLPVARLCHGRHHSGRERYELRMLPDSVYEFAAEVLGARAHAYLNRRYAGLDPRLDALLLIPAVDRGAA